MPKKIEKKEIVRDKKEVLVELLLREIPNCFDDYPRQALSRSGVERLVDKILE